MDEWLLDECANDLVTALKKSTNENKRLTDTDWCTSCRDCKHSIRYDTYFYCSLNRGRIALNNRNFCIRHSEHVI